MMSSLPRPDQDALDLSARLTDRIRAEIERSGGWIGFEQFMHRVLYEPGLGYYSAGSAKFGAAGDFVTAPEMGGIFGEMVARHVMVLLAALEGGSIVEFGAGTGKLAQDLLSVLGREGLAPCYRIVEPSAELAARQRALLAPFAEQVEWLERWPVEPFCGVVLANEVLDALPVSRFVKRDSGVHALGVVWREHGFAWAEVPADPALAAAVTALETRLGGPLADGFRSEICRALPGWVEAVATPLRAGFLLLCDYGLVQREYYHATRGAGTLSCHYRHHIHDDPFFLPGLQDLSAWVDFSACADAAQAAGLEVAGFTTQGQFLVAGGAHELVAAAEGPAAFTRARELSRLVLPGEMGERFKVLQLARNVREWPKLPGRDLVDRL
jgi:SAM-dependent MidA family methyltransferase